MNYITAHKMYKQATTPQEEPEKELSQEELDAIKAKKEAEAALLSSDGRGLGPAFGRGLGPGGGAGDGSGMVDGVPRYKRLYNTQDPNSPKRVRSDNSAVLLASLIKNRQGRS